MTVEDLFDFQKASSLLDADSCRNEGIKCAAIPEFLDVLQRIRGRMETLATTSGKIYILQEIQEGMK